MLKKISKTLLVGGAALAMSAGIVSAAETNLRIQTHYAPETVSGKLAGQYVDDIQTMSERRNQGGNVLLVFRREVG